MIEVNGKQYSGAVLKNDDSELVISIYSSDSLQDMCIAFDNVKEVTEISNGVSNVIHVNTAVQISSGIKDVYAITFSKKQTIIQEMSEAIDKLLLMVLEV